MNKTITLIKLDVDGVIETVTTMLEDSLDTDSFKEMISEGYFEINLDGLELFLKNTPENKSACLIDGTLIYKEYVPKEEESIQVVEI
jgi:hypothetical protein